MTVVLHSETVGGRQIAQKCQFLHDVALSASKLTNGDKMSVTVMLDYVLHHSRGIPAVGRQFVSSAEMADPAIKT